MGKTFLDVQEKTHMETETIFYIIVTSLFGLFVLYMMWCLYRAVYPATAQRKLDPEDRNILQKFYSSSSTRKP